MPKSGGTKLCKHCKTEIPADAKVCPNCRKRQSGVVKWVIIVIVALVIIAALASGGEEDGVKKVENSGSQPESSVSASTTPSSTLQSQEEQELIFKVGETAEYNSVQVTLLGVTESNGSDFNKPAEGNIYVLAEFEIANNSDKELTISSIMMFDAYQDGYATNLSLTAEVEADGETLDGTIAPGKKMKGKIGYEIPSDCKELEIYVHTDVWSSKKIKFLYER